MSNYLRTLRAHVGSMRLVLPSVSVHLFDADGRLLLVRQRDGDVWSTPGGMIEPDELPADAAVRELWEETGLLFQPEQVLGVYGGADFVVMYPNGDQVQYVITAFGGPIVGGALRPDGDEVVAADYFTFGDASQLVLSSWLRPILSAVYAARASGVAFEPSTWRPTSATAPEVRADDGR
jgi:8-oxo-dGTP pyrophosphatase MutT (NUDIX family)